MQALSFIERFTDPRELAEAWQSLYTQGPLCLYMLGYVYYGEITFCG